MGDAEDLVRKLGTINSIYADPGANVGAGHVHRDQFLYQNAAQVENASHVGDNHYHFGAYASADTLPLKRPLNTQLKHWTALPTFNRLPAHLVEEQASKLRSKRLIVILGHAADRRATRHAAFSLVELMRRDASLKVLESNYGVKIDLASLSADCDWHAHCRDALIIIDRRTEANGAELDDALVDHLIDAAAQARCYFIVMAGPRRQHTGAWSAAEDETCPVWILAAQPCSTNATDRARLAHKLNDPLLSLVLLTATVFPGLDALEFSKVVDALLASREPEKKSKEKRAADEPSSALARWRKGERDAVLGESGLSFGPDSEGAANPNALAAPGYYFSDALERVECQDYLLRHAPHLYLTHRRLFEERYFRDEASARYCADFRRYAVDLHLRRIHRLDGKTLRQHYFDAVKQTTEREAHSRFVELLRALAEHPDGREAVEETLAQSSASAQRAETDWQRRLLAASYRAEVSREWSHDGNATARALGLASEYDALLITLCSFFDLVIVMAQAVPVAAGNALCECLAGEDFRQHFFVAAQSPLADRATIPSVGIFQDRLKMAFTCAPVYLMDCARALTQCTYKQARPATHGAESANLLFSAAQDRLAMAWILSASACFDSIAEAAQQPPFEPLYDPRFEGLFARQVAPSNGALLTDLAQLRAEALLRRIDPSAWRFRFPVQWFEEACAASLWLAILLVESLDANANTNTLTDTTSDAGAATEAGRTNIDIAEPRETLVQLLAPLRERRYRDLRAALLDTCRGVIDALRQKRQTVNPGGDRALLTLRLQAMQHVLHALKAPIASTARTRKLSDADRGRLPA